MSRREGVSSGGSRGAVQSCVFDSLSGWQWVTSSLLPTAHQRVGRPCAPQAAHTPSLLPAPRAQPVSGTGQASPRGWANEPGLKTPA